MTYTIEASGFKLRIEIVELNKLKIHEEVIPSSLRNLVNSIKSDGYLKNPVIVDEKTHVVLDGMHRVAALKEIGCRFALVCSVNYRDPRVKLGVWHRLFYNGGMETILNLCNGLGFKAKPCKFKEAKKTPIQGELKLALISEDQCFLLENERDPPKVYKKVGDLEHVLMEGGVTINYETRGDILQKIKSGGVGLLIPLPSKDDVINIALSGSVFAHKTTRHVVPARPMGVRIPLKWLRDGKSLEEVNEELTNLLERQEIERLPPGNMFEDRRYEEELYIFR